MGSRVDASNKLLTVGFCHVGEGLPDFIGTVSRLFFGLG